MRLLASKRVRKATSLRQPWRAPTWVEHNQPAIQIIGMAKKPELPKLTSWAIYKIAAKAVWMGEVEASDEATAIEKAAAEYKVPAAKLMAMRR